MSDSRRLVEIYSAGCGACDAAVQLVRSIASDSCDITVRDMHDPEVASRARALGVTRVPAVVVDGSLASCCATSEVNVQELRRAGIGHPL